MLSPEESHTPASNEEESSREQSAESTKQHSREGSRPPKKRHNVRFTPGGESLDTSNHRAAFDLRDDTDPPPRPKPLPRVRSNTVRRSNSLRAASLEKTFDIAESSASAPVPKPRPSIMRLPSSESDSGDNDNDTENEEDQEDEDGREEEEKAVGKAISQQTAQNRAERLSRMMGSHSAPGSRFASPQRPQRTVARSPPPSPPPEGERPTRLDLNDIHLERLETRRTKFGIEDDTDEDDEKGAETSSLKKGIKRSGRFYTRAARLVAHHKSARIPGLFRVRAETSPETASGVQTPTYERDPNHYVPRPKEYREGYLSSLLKLYNEQGAGTALSHIPSGHDAITRAAHRRDGSGQSLIGSTASGATTPAQTPMTSPAGSATSSGTTTPRPKHQKWYYKNAQSQSTGALSDLVSSSTVFAQPTTGSSHASKAIRPKAKHRPLSSQALDTVMGKKKKGPKNDDSIRIQVHIAETMQRQGYLIKICRALMTYGAPTHRLEGTYCCKENVIPCSHTSTEYMRMSSRVLEIDGQFLYIPGCMIISFDDQSTHTTEVKIVRATQGVNLGKLRDTHEVYKEVVHDTIGVEEAMERLDEIIRKKDDYSPWFRVIVYGFASMCVGPFAFGGKIYFRSVCALLRLLLGSQDMLRENATSKTDHTAQTVP